MSTRSAARKLGAGQILIVVYAILAIAATGRSVFQILTKFDTAPIAYVLSAVAAVVYLLATIALVRSASGWFVFAFATVSFELAGVLVVGLLSVLDPVLFPADTVWSFFGRGYGFIPLILPILGLLYLIRQRRVLRQEAV